MIDWLIKQISKYESLVNNNKEVECYEEQEEELGRENASSYYACLIYEPLLPILLFCLLERVDDLFPCLLADGKDLDVDNNVVPYQAYPPLLECDEH